MDEAKIFFRLKDGHPPAVAWLLFDVSNGHDGSKNYVWWFETRKKARSFKNDHLRRKRTKETLTDLVGPFPYRFSGGKNTVESISSKDYERNLERRIFGGK